MPNFKCKKIKSLELPQVFGDVSFLFATKVQHSKVLLCTQVKNSQFFLEINQKNKEFIIKIDKLSKTTDLALMQLALKTFEQYFCEEIISKAYEFKEKRCLKDNVISSVLDFLELANSKKNVYLEIGFGSGRHLLYQAKNNPDNFYIGLEIHKPSLIQVSRLASELKNVLLLDFDARIAISLLKSNHLNGIYLHFPVPWDDAPHRRVISKDFREQALRVLKPGGFFELRSDSKNYAFFAKEIFRHDDFAFFMNKNAAITSKYEDRWLRQNKNIYDLVVRKTTLANDELQSEFQSEFSLNPSKVQVFKHIDTDFFLKINRVYEVQNSSDLILQLSYGSFDMPSSSYAKISGEKAKFELLFKPFCPSDANKKAFNKLKELLA